MKNVYQLFGGRHEIPNNPPALYSKFDFENFQPIPQLAGYFDERNELDPVPFYNEDFALDELESGEEVSLYVTGLTPALTYFISKAVKIGKGSLILLHFNKESGEYVEQKIF